LEWEGRGVEKKTEKWEGVVGRMETEKWEGVVGILFGNNTPRFPDFRDFPKGYTPL